MANHMARVTRGQTDTAVAGRSPDRPAPMTEGFTFVTGDIPSKRWAGQETSPQRGPNGRPYVSPGNALGNDRLNPPEGVVQFLSLSFAKDYECYTLPLAGESGSPARRGFHSPRNTNGGQPPITLPGR